MGKQMKESSQYMYLFNTVQDVCAGVCRDAVCVCALK